MEYLRKYYLIIFVLLFIIMIIVNQQNYKRTEKIIRSDFETEIELIKNNVFNSLENAFAAYSISEILLNQEMEENSQLLLQEYERNPDPLNWDLTELQAEMPSYEIYIINQDLKIINTTLSADLGLDFSKLAEFSGLLKSRLEAGKFTADKMDLSQNTGAIQKYSYQPTPDSKYLLELSIDIRDRFPILGNFNIFTTAEVLSQKYEQLQSINFYKFSSNTNRVGLLNSSNPSELEPVSPTAKEMVIKTVQSKNIQNNSFQNEDYQIYDMYLPLLAEGGETDSEWWNSFVVRVRYDSQALINELAQERSYAIFNIVIIFIIFILFSIIMTYFIRKTESMAYHDPLTGLPNRKAFENYFNQIKKKNYQQNLAVLYLDLDGFKAINDNYGHETGDLLLKAVGSRLKNTLRSKDRVSRIGGDEFTLLLTDISDDGDIKKIVKKIEKKISEPYQIKGKRVEIDCSIGYSISHRAEESFQNIINKADLAMYEVKSEKN